MSITSVTLILSTLALVLWESAIRTIRQLRATVVNQQAELDQLRKELAGVQLRACSCGDGSQLPCPQHNPKLTNQVIAELLLERSNAA